MSHLWSAFIDLNATRPSGMAVGAITFEEIRAYSELMKLDIEPREVQTLRRLDVTWLISRRDADG